MPLVWNRCFKSTVYTPDTMENNKIYYYINLKKNNLTHDTGIFICANNDADICNQLNNLYIKLVSRYCISSIC